MRSNQTRPDLKRDLQILHRYKNSIQVILARIAKRSKDEDYIMLLKILKSVKVNHVSKLHQIINRNLKHQSHVKQSNSDTKI